MSCPTRCCKANNCSVYLTMQFYSVNTRNFKRAFVLVAIGSVMAILASYFIGKSGLFFTPVIGFSRKITFPLLLLAFIAAAWYGRSIRKQLHAMWQLNDFELKVQEYEKIYRSRLQWNLVGCLILCILFILTGRNFFFYFSIFQFLLVLPFFPSAALFKRELKNDEIILY